MAFSSWFPNFRIWGISAALSETNTGQEDKDDYSNRLCLICGGAENGLNVFVLRAPEHLNGRIQHDLATVHSSVPIRNDQEGEQNTPSSPHPFSAFISFLKQFFFAKRVHTFFGARHYK